MSNKSNKTRVKNTATGSKLLNNIILLLFVFSIFIFLSVGLKHILNCISLYSTHAQENNKEEQYTEAILANSEQLNLYRDSQNLNTTASESLADLQTATTTTVIDIQAYKNDALVAVDMDSTMNNPSLLDSLDIDTLIVQLKCDDLKSAIAEVTNLSIPCVDYTVVLPSNIIIVTMKF